MTISWKAVILAGLVAGALLITLQMLLVMLVSGASPWGPPRLIAAMVLGSGAAPPPADFDFLVVLVGIAVHLGLSVAAAAVVGALISLTGADLTWSVIGGTSFGLILYMVTFYALTAAFPWLVEARSGLTLFNYLVYAGVLAAVYRLAAAPVEVPPTE